MPPTPEGARTDVPGGPIGARHPAVGRLRRLVADVRARRGEGAFVLEGPVGITEAIRAGVELEVVLLDVGRHDDLAARLPAGTALHRVDEGVLARAADAVTSQGAAAIARQPRHELAEVPPGLPLLVLVGIADPGNAGTLVRSAEAAGFGAVLFTAGSVDPWSPKAVRASAGSVLRVWVLCGGEAEGVLDEVKATGRRRVGTRGLDAPAYTDAALPADVALVLGNEAHGLPASLDAHLDGWVRIPMAGEVESLNVAMAGTLLCFEVARARREPAAGA